MARLAALVTLLGLLLGASACGGSDERATPTPPSTPTTTVPQPSTAATQPSTAPATTQQGPPALQAEAKSAATGDVPDNQVYVLFRNLAARYSLKYPEGWAQTGGSGRVTFRDKNNIVRILVTKGKPATLGQVRSEVRGLRGAHLQAGPQRVSLPTGPAIKVVYTTESAPNPVTGKRVTLAVDRYYLAHGAKEAIVDLGTPLGVDNVDAYRLMIESFRWR